MGDPGRKKWIARPGTRSALRYGLALISVAGALGLAYIFLSFHLPQPFTAFALCAIALTFWYGGLKPGILAAVLASLLRPYFFEAETNNLSRALYDLVFVIFALLMARVTRMRSELEARVAGRTEELTRASEELKLEIVERKRAAVELRQSQTYLAEAQRLSHTGSFGWKPSTGEIFWSEETFRIFRYDRSLTPTLELIFQRIHPEDRARVKQTIEQASPEGKNFEFEHRLLMPDGSVKHLRVVAHALSDEARNDEARNIEYAGAVMDVTAAKNVEESLRRSESYLAEAQSLTHTGSGAWRVPEGDALYLSEEWYRIYGFEPTQGLSAWKDRMPRMHPEDRAKVQEAKDRAIREKSNYEVEHRIILPDGAVKHTYTVGHPVLSAAGVVEQFVCTMMDITERKRGQALAEGERRVLEMIAGDAPLQEVLEQLVRIVEARFTGQLCSILLLDEDGLHIRHGAAPSLPKPYVEAINGLPIGPQAGSCGTAMYRKEPVVVTDILQDPLWTDYRAVAEPYGLRACWSTPILAHSGKVLGSFAMYYREPRSPGSSENSVLKMATHLAGIAIERELTHQQLQRSEAYLTEAQRLTQTGSWAYNVFTGKLIHSSEEHSRLYGFDPERHIPSFEEFVQRIHAEDRTRVMQAFESASRAGRDFDAYFRIVVPEGDTKYVYATGHPVFDSSGDVGEFVGIVMDVTERKRAEEEREHLRQTQSELAHINRLTMMGELTVSLAHEVNQPIAAALTDASTCVRWLTRDQPDLVEACNAASRVVKDATRAGEIISRIRLLFKKGAPQWAPVDVNEIIQEMIILLRGEATPHSISVRTELADLPPVMGDRVQLQQVLMNLMINGIDAMRKVDGARELTVRSQRAEDGRLMVSVSDTGVGLSPQLADQMFNAFFTTKPHGTGMGLRISRSIVESHGGRLWAADNSPRGARFCLTLPTKAEAHE